MKEATIVNLLKIKRQLKSSLEKVNFLSWQKNVLGTIFILICSFHCERHFLINSRWLSAFKVFIIYFMLLDITGGHLLLCNLYICTTVYY